MINIKGLIKDEESVIGENKYKNLENPIKPTPEDISILENYLKGNKHIEKLYICANGKLALGKFQYRGGFPELSKLEGKFYSKMDVVQKSVYSVKTKKDMSKNFWVPIPEFEIVGEYTNKGFKEFAPKLNKDEYIKKKMTLLFENYLSNTNQNIQFGIEDISK